MREALARESASWSWPVPAESLRSRRADTATLLATRRAIEMPFRTLNVFLLKPSE